MTRAFLYGLMIVAVGGSLMAQSVRAQTNDPGLDEEPPDRVRRNKDNKTRGDAAYAKLGQSKTEKMFQDFSKAMQWELKTSRDHTEQIKQIMKQFREEAEASKAADKQKGQEELTKPGEPGAKKILEMREEAKKAIMKGDRDLARSIIQELPKRARGFKDTIEELDPRMFYAIDAVLDEPIRTQFWQIVSRFADKSRVNPGAIYLDLLRGVNLSSDQGVAISLHYRDYTEAMRTADKDDSDLLKEVQGTFQNDLLAELNEKQQQKFNRALKDFDRLSRRHKQKAEGSTRW